MRQVTDLIIEALIYDLGEAFEDVPDNEIAGVIRGGRLQANPENLRINITLHVGDPDDPKGWRDNLLARKDHALDRQFFQAEGFEIGGGKTWWRRGTVKWEFFGTKSKESRPEAQQIASNIRARIERAIDTSDRVPQVVDDFGEMAVLVHVADSMAVEGGGPPNQFIWRGSVRFEAMTEKSY